MTNVCNTQDTFNVAFDNALKQNNKDAVKKAKPWIYVYATLLMIFFIWALLLAMQVAPGPNKIVHLVFAMVFSPLYVIAYYLGAIDDNKGVMMGMSRFY
jgi:hypothetical protein